MMWQPIETAPKDGAAILACAAGWDDISLVRWRWDKWVGVCDGEDSIRSQSDFGTDYHEPYVTHWMRLPVAHNEERDS